MTPLRLPTPPRLAERILEWIVGSDPEGLSILGDAREELAARGERSRLGAHFWYWTYVLRFVLTYRGGGRDVLGGARWNLKMSIRALRRRPWLTLAIVSTLAVGIGTTTLAFTLVDGVLLRPLPYPAADALVDVSRVDPDWYGPTPSAAQAGNVFATPAATYHDWARMARSYTAFGAYAWHTSTFTGAQDPDRVEGAVATSGVFAALSIPAALGRHLVPEDDRPGASPVVVLSHALWSRRFSAEPSVVGTTATMDGIPHTVVGVMPPGFVFPDGSTEYWVDFDDDAHASTMRNAGYLHALGRLAPGVTLEDARREMVDITARLSEEHPVEGDFIPVIWSRQALVVAPARPGLLLLLASTLVVLLIGCANVVNLLLARVMERGRELALHAALGAGRARVAMLVLGESLALAVAGGGAGIALAAWSLRSFLGTFPIELPTVTTVGIDGRDVVWVLGASLLVGLLVGVFPLLGSRRLDLNAILRDGGRGATDGGRRWRGHGILVVSEVALAVLLLTTSGASLQAYFAQTAQERGFEATGVLTARVAPSEALIETPERTRTFFEQLLKEVAAVPGVLAVSLADQMPYSGGFSSPPASVDTEGGIGEASVHTSAVTRDYFSTMGIPVVRGRGFSTTDDAGTLPVAVVSEAMVRRFWPNEDPIGRRVRLETEDEPEWIEVVGVVGSLRYQFGAAEAAEYYRLFEQTNHSTMTLTVKHDPAQTDPTREIEQILRRADPAMPVQVRSLATREASDYGRRTTRATSLLLSILAAVSTALAVVGVYGVLAYGVARRRREIGIRSSLGGDTFEILTSVMKGGLMMCGVGVAIGVAVAIALSRLLSSTVFGVPQLRPSVLLGVVATMAATTLIASLVPAWRAAHLDPMVAFRDE